MTETATTAALSGGRARALVAYIGLSGFVILCIWAAFFLAGAGVFGLNDRNLKVKDIGDQGVLDPHRVVGNVIGGVVLLMLIAAIISRPGPRLLGGTILLLVLTALQGTFAAVGEDHRWVGGVHVLNGGVILAVAFWLHLSARKVPRA